MNLKNHKNINEYPSYIFFSQENPTPPFNNLLLIFIHLKKLKKKKKLR